MLLLISSTNIFSSVDMSKWEKSLVKDGIVVYKKNIYQGNIIPLLVKAQINYPLDVIMSVLGASNRRTEWIPRQKSSQLLKRNSHYDRIEHSVTNVPWPFNNREFVYSAVTEILKKEKTIIIHMHSVDWPTFKNGNVRGYMHDGTMILRQIKKRVIEFTMKFESDPKGMIPNWIINIAQKKWPVNFIKNLRAQLKKVDLEGGHEYAGIDFFNLSLEQKRKAYDIK
jgi:hypothetical protein